MPDNLLNLSQRVKGLSLGQQQQDFGRTIMPELLGRHLDELGALERQIKGLKDQPSMTDSEELKKLDDELTRKKDLLQQAKIRSATLRILSNPDELVSSFPQSLLHDGQELQRVLKLLEEKNIQPGPSDLDSVNLEEIEGDIDELEKQIKTIQEQAEQADYSHLEQEEEILESLQAREAFSQRLRIATAKFGPRARKLSANLEATIRWKEGVKALANLKKAESNKKRKTDLESYIKEAQKLIDNYKLAIEDNPGLLEIDPNEHAKERKFKEQLRGSYEVAQTIITKAQEQLKLIEQETGDVELPEIDKEYDTRVQRIKKQIKELEGEVKTYIKDLDMSETDSYKIFAKNLTGYIEFYNEAEKDSIPEDMKFANGEIEKLKSKNEEMFEAFVRLNPDHKALLKPEKIDPEILTLNHNELIHRFNGRPDRNLLVFRTWLNAQNGQSLPLQWGVIAGLLTKMGIGFHKNGDEVQVTSREFGDMVLSKEKLLASRESLTTELSKLSLGGQI